MNQLKNLNAVILCGGKSSRMGQDKSKLMIDDKNLTQIQVEKFSQIFNHVYVSAKEDKFNKQFDLIKDKDDFNFYSPMLALYSILSYFKEEWVFILSVDSPKVGLKEVEKLFQAVSLEEKIVVAKTPLYKHSLCGFYHSSLASYCLECLKNNEQKIGILFSKVKTKFVKFEDESVFLNLNFYEEYEKFKREFK